MGKIKEFFYRWYYVYMFIILKSGKFSDDETSIIIAGAYGALGVVTFPYLMLLAWFLFFHDSIFIQLPVYIVIAIPAIIFILSHIYFFWKKRYYKIYEEYYLKQKIYPKLFIRFFVQFLDILGLLLNASIAIYIKYK